MKMVAHFHPSAFLFLTEVIKFYITKMDNPFVDFTVMLSQGKFES
jgi:hypothetical protein